MRESARAWEKYSTSISCFRKKKKNYHIIFTQHEFQIIKMRTNNINRISDFFIYRFTFNIFDCRWKFVWSYHGYLVVFFFKYNYQWCHAINSAERRIKYKVILWSHTDLEKNTRPKNNPKIKFQSVVYSTHWTVFNVQKRLVNNVHKSELCGI